MLILSNCFSFKRLAVCIDNFSLITNAKYLSIRFRWALLKRGRDALSRFLLHFFFSSLFCLFPAEFPSIRPFSSPSRFCLLLLCHIHPLLPAPPHLPHQLFPSFTHAPIKQRMREGFNSQWHSIEVILKLIWEIGIIYNGGKSRK